MSRLGAAAEGDPVVALGEAAQAVESGMRAAGPAIGRHYAWLRSLKATARAAGMDPALLLGPIAANVEQWMIVAQAWGKAIRAMDQGRAELQPWRVGNGPIAFAVRKLNGETGSLGWWGVAIKVLQVASAAAITGIAYLVQDAWQTTKALEAQTESQRVAILGRLAEAQAADPRAAAIIAKALGRADSEGSAGASSWLSTLAGSAGAGLGGAAIALGALYFLSRGRDAAPRPKPKPAGPSTAGRVATGLGAGAGGGLVALAVAWALSKGDRA